MDDGRDRSAEPSDPQRPIVCMDERPSQLLADGRESLPMEPGQPQRVDDAYQRHGACNLLLFFQPRRGWRAVHATERRTNDDVARQMQWLVDAAFPAAEGSRVVLDNRNTHTPAAWYQAFPPEEARRLTRKVEFHYTPKHASWLNMAEIEFSILARQCLGRRLPDRERVRQEIKALVKARNAARATVEWRFTTAHARLKFHRFYPK